MSFEYAERLGRALHNAGYNAVINEADDGGYTVSVYREDDFIQLITRNTTMGQIDWLLK